MQLLCIITYVTSYQASNRYNNTVHYYILIKIRKLYKIRFMCIRLHTDFAINIWLENLAELHVIAEFSQLKQLRNSRFQSKIIFYPVNLKILKKRRHIL